MSYHLIYKLYTDKSTNQLMQPVLSIFWNYTFWAYELWYVIIYKRMFYNFSSQLFIPTMRTKITLPSRKKGLKIKLSHKVWSQRGWVRILNCVISIRLCRVDLQPSHSKTVDINRKKMSCLVPPPYTYIQSG